MRRMRPYQNYQRIEVSTAEPLRIVILLYEGAIRNLTQSARVFETDAMTASQRINKTLDIINYLHNCLDYEQGGKTAFDLGRLYDYMRDTLAMANIKKDTAKIEEVIRLLQTLLEGWRGVENKNAAVPAVGDEAAMPDAEARVNVSLMG